MCGISGIIRRNSNFEEIHTIVQEMANALSHRGPDYLGVWNNDEIGFGHNRLSLLDLSENANQPFKNERYILVFNGEIYNYNELKANYFKAEEIKFRTTSDTEVLFNMLIKYGIDETLPKLKGMFAFSFYDLIKKKLFIVRDRFGIKPIFYTNKNNSFAFASEYKAIYNLFEDAKPEKALLIHSFSGVYETQRHLSPIEDVYQLEPGNYLEINAETLSISEKKWFSLNEYIVEADFNRRMRSSPMEINLEFDNLFQNSISSMCISDAPMGVFVSGGVDSSLVAAVSNNFSKLDLLTANVKGKFSELNAAQNLANYLGLNLHKVDFGNEDYSNLIVDCTWSYEAPIVLFVNSLPFSKVSKLAREMQIKAVLTGENSDELFLGYPRLLTKRYDNFLLFPYNILNKIYKKIPQLSKYLALDSQRFTHDILNNHITGYREKSYLNEYEMGFKFLEGNDEEYRCALLTGNLMNRHLHSLLWRNDRIGMMHSIESRFPFLDENLVKFGINLPAKYKIGKSMRMGNWKHPFLIDKAIVRNNSSKYLPNELFRRNKQGFPVDSHDGKTIIVNDSFFINGFWQNEWKLTNKNFSELLAEMDPKLKIKLSSVEIWGKLFVLNQPKLKVQQDVFESFLNVNNF
jgi:asparagine synthase (glutamine-hydrolysing)